MIVLEKRNEIEMFLEKAVGKGFVCLMEISIHEVHIVRAGPERIVDVEPFWKALHIYQQEIDPSLSFRSLDQSWAFGRLKHEEWLSEIGSFMLFAEYRDKPVGYAIIHHRKEEVGMWQIADRIAIMEILSVLPGARNIGIGTALVNAAYEELRLSNVGELVLNVLYTNTDALRFYKRCGMVPRLLEMRKPISQKQAAE